MTNQFQNHIQNFLISNYGYYIERGLTPRSSLMRTSREAYEGLYYFMGSADVDSKDLVILEHTLAYRDFINKRGLELTKSEEADSEEVQLLSDLNQALSHVQEYYFKTNELYEKKKREEKKQK